MTDTAERVAPEVLGPVERTLDDRPDKPLYTLYPARSVVTPGPLPSDRELVLSRFAVLHREDGGLLIESPRSWCDVRVHDPAVLAVIGAFAMPQRRAAAGDMLPPAALDRLIADLWEACLLVPADGSEEETELRLRQWSPFELWTHTRSRLGEHGGFNASWGLTGWGADHFPPLPARPEPYAGTPVELYAPDLDELRRTDPSYTDVVESRVSVREHDDANLLTARQLGEFLYRCARVRGTSELDGIEHVDRPYPSGGALHELEIYPVVRRVDGLEPGMYHYDGHEHVLRKVCEPNDATGQIVTGACLATGAEDPQLVLVITARFGRLLWKYEGMGYAAVLKDVGVLFGVFYAAATAMGLAPCGIGGGHLAAFNDASGRDIFTESTVGEFLLGSRPAAVDRQE